MNKLPKHICISRTDSIGDVILTLPLAGYLKKEFPESKISFLCRKYTVPIVECCSDIDEIIVADEIEAKKDVVAQLKSLRFTHFIHVFPNSQWAKWVKKAGVEFRIGTSHRFFHWLNCNQKVDFTRKNSDLHESQLNFHLLKPLGLKETPKFDEVFRFLSFKPMNEKSNFLFNENDKKRVVLHPLSQGSAMEWGIENFVKLSEELVKRNCEVYFSGTEKEGLIYREHIPQNEFIHDVTGKFNLSEFISFINNCDALVAASTGPLHIAGVLNKKAVGLFSPIRPIHPGRWRPLGKNTSILTGRLKGTFKGRKFKENMDLSEISIQQIINELK